MRASAAARQVEIHRVRLVDHPVQRQQVVTLPPAAAAAALANRLEPQHPADRRLWLLDLRPLKLSENATIATT